MYKVVDDIDTNMYEFMKAGIPEGGGRRAATWRVLLNYLPPKWAIGKSETLNISLNKVFL